MVVAEFREEVGRRCLREDGLETFAAKAARLEVTLLA